MRTTPALIARLAGEIETRFRGARVTDAGLLADGRTAIVLHHRKETSVLALDIFGTPPLITVETHEPAVAAEPGFVRALATTLRATTLLSAKARKGDRLVRLTFGSRSRFGVGDEVELFIELVPRFGNIVLVKNDRVVAAGKEFTLAENPARAVLAGQPYVLPPLVARPTADDDGDPVPVLERMEAHATAGRGDAMHARTAQRRAALARRLAVRERKFHAERAKLDEQFARVAGREGLREEGEAIFGSMHELPDEARTEAKERANALFTRYKKLGASRPHLEARRATLDASIESAEALAWEVERASDADLDDVERAIETLEGRPMQRRAAKKRKRAPLEVHTVDGSRILIGRSPSENAELTFHVARSGDLWFHAQKIPGAHVIVQRDDRAPIPDLDIARAAALAAYYSKARASAKVAVDYTERKHVRAQRDAPPGLVWYTNARTIVVEPRDLPALEARFAGAPIDVG